jgi:hypothetical protein
MGSAEHFLFKEETTWGTYVAPDKAIPVRSAGINPETTFMEIGVTGGNRGRRPGARGELAVNGPVETVFYPETLGFLVASLFNTRAQTAKGTGWLNKLLPDDNVENKSFSIQKRYSPTRAESIRGAKINTMTISARSREYATIAMEFAAKDATATGGTWRDGASAPAVVDPVPYQANLADAFKFYQGEFVLGGTTAITAGEIVVSGGTARCEIDNVEIEANMNLATDAYGLCLTGGDTVSGLPEGQRELTLRFDPNFDTVGFEFYNAWLNGTPGIAQLHFLGPIFNSTFHYDVKITLPYVVYQGAPNPEINADYGLKRATVEAGAYVDPTLLVDWGIAWQTTDDLVP